MLLKCCFAPLAVVLLSIGQLSHATKGRNVLPQLAKDIYGRAVALPDDLTLDSIQEAFEKVKQEKPTKEEGISIRRFRPSRFRSPNLAGSRHLAFLTGSVRSSFLERTQKFFEDATKELKTRFQLNRDQISGGLSRIDLSKFPKRKEFDRCQELFRFPCDSASPYRTIDGSCNNLEHHTWGMAESCHDRFVPPDYADGLSERRRSKLDRPLPHPRIVSIVIHSQLTRPIPKANHMLMLWGQMIAHDLTLTPASRKPSENCCPMREKSHPECSSIHIRKDDPFYSRFDVSCLPNVRSAACSTCVLGPRQQINQHTSFIDASMIYGTSLNESRSLRNLDGTGTLRFTSSDLGGELLPTSPNPESDFCSFQHPEFNCFVTGDKRVNQHPPLTAMHVILLREHNRLARRLKILNRSWGEERLFQEARRILVAQLQMITYNEFLPLLLGPDWTRRHKLNVRPSRSTTYDPTAIPRISIEFSSAAFRVGHSMVHGFFRESTESDPRGGHMLRDVFMFPFPLYTGHLEGILAGFFVSSSESADRHMAEDLTNHLYQVAGNASGLDLAAININRGRDNGVPGYTTLLEFCGGPKITSWSGLEVVFQPGVSSRFQKVYDDVEDIDLFSGGLAERPVPGGVVGRTFACLIAKQFTRIKFGDRFYFEHTGETGSFTADQLQEIKLTTLSKLICRNSKVENIQQNLFKFPSNENPILPCYELATFDLTFWKEKLFSFKI